MTIRSIYRLLGLALLVLAAVLHNEAVEVTITACGRPLKAGDTQKGKASRYFGRNPIELLQEPLIDSILDNAQRIDKCAIGVGLIGLLILLVSLFDKRPVVVIHEEVPSTPNVEPLCVTATDRNASAI